MANNNKNVKQRNILSFDEAEIGNEGDGIERQKVEEGQEFLILKLQIVPSVQYDGDVLRIDAESIPAPGDQFGEEIYLYTLARALISISRKLLKKYGDSEGFLSTPIRVKVSTKESEQGNKYLIFQ